MQILGLLGMYYDALVVEVETFLLLLWSLKKIIPPFQKKSLSLVILRQIIKNFIPSLDASQSNSCQCT